MKVFLEKVSILAGFLMIAFLSVGWAKAPQKTPELGLCPLQVSQAYSQFLKRPVCEVSKVMYLIDRFKDLPYEIIYDGHTYKIKAVSGVVYAFLRFNYKKDWPARQWILKYANRSLGLNELIMLRLPDGRTYRAGDILLQELENLERTIAESKIPQSPIETIELPKQFNPRIEGAAIKSDTLALPAAAQ